MTLGTIGRFKEGEGRKSYSSKNNRQNREGVEVIVVSIKLLLERFGEFGKPNICVRWRD